MSVVAPAGPHIVVELIRGKSRGTVRRQMEFRAGPGSVKPIRITAAEQGEDLGDRAPVWSEQKPEDRRDDHRRDEDRCEDEGLVGAPRTGSDAVNQSGEQHGNEHAE
ncbi:MAG: hypothetical protein JWR01_2736 [Subtercola sp.]|nr:hypothetical protein [Subtercola sp.]